MASRELSWRLGRVPVHLELIYGYHYRWKSHGEFYKIMGCTSKVDNVEWARGNWKWTISCSGCCAILGRSIILSNLTLPKSVAEDVPVFLWVRSKTWKWNTFHQYTIWWNDMLIQQRMDIRPLCTLAWTCKRNFCMKTRASAIRGLWRFFWSSIKCENLTQIAWLQTLKQYGCCRCWLEW